MKALFEREVTNMADLPFFTYKTRPALSPTRDATLVAYAALYGRAERSLFCATRATTGLTIFMAY